MKSIKLILFISYGPLDHLQWRFFNQNLTIENKEIKEENRRKSEEKFQNKCF